MPGHRILEYAEEHPEEVIQVLEDRTDALVRELEERERVAQRALREPVEPAGWPETFAETAPESYQGDVPF